MREAPNITDKNLPHIPPLNHLLDRYSMQADAPHFVPGPEYGDEDDFYIAAEKVLAFAHTREYFLFFLLLFSVNFDFRNWHYSYKQMKLKKGGE